ncbi:uncharacterized protein LOC110881108 [Helianthus annuus]|uniref:uncharacterized protein LOC110881108 n=1 Tax=Helianthus annuus TaxID=4232 RepID=UPI0016532A31|nr:uncharacterized protein LOC110881108 [Helianthus annuus]
MCAESWGRSSYARALIEVQAGADFKRSVTVAIPSLDDSSCPKNPQFVSNGEAEKMSDDFQVVGSKKKKANNQGLHMKNQKPNYQSLFMNINKFIFVVENMARSSAGRGEGQGAGTGQGGGRGSGRGGGQGAGQGVSRGQLQHELNDVDEHVAVVGRGPVIPAPLRTPENRTWIWVENDEFNDHDKVSRTIGSNLKSLWWVHGKDGKMFLPIIANACLSVFSNTTDGKIFRNHQFTHAGRSALRGSF